MSTTNSTIPIAPPPPPIPAATPTLRVMRLQNPELYASPPSLLSLTGGMMVLHNSFSLPDSLIVYVGETFTAYLGIFNHHPTLTLRKVTVSAQLQTPNHRHQLSTTMTNNSNNNNKNNNAHVTNITSGSNEILPGRSIDTIVSRKMDEYGQHILRVEVSYYQGGGPSSSSNEPSSSSTAATTATTQSVKTFRKFYRFHVIEPLTITIDHIIRFGDTKCYVAMTVVNQTATNNNQDNNNNNNNNNDDTQQQQQAAHNNNLPAPLMISSVTFEAANGLSAKMIGTGSSIKTLPCDDNDHNEMKISDDDDDNHDDDLHDISALQLYDAMVGGTRIRTISSQTTTTTNTPTPPPLLPSQKNMTITKSNSGSPTYAGGRSTSGRFPFSTTTSTTTVAASVTSPATFRYCFQIEVNHDNDNNDNGTLINNGISSGDLLGRIYIVWKKPMGEMGTVVSPTLYCPKVSLSYDHPAATTTTTTTTTKVPYVRKGSSASNAAAAATAAAANTTTTSHSHHQAAQPPPLVVYRSGLTIDVAASAASLARTNPNHSNIPKNMIRSLANQYPITIEPIEPPSTMKLHTPQTISFLIVNHTEQNVSIQVQFRHHNANMVSSSSSASSSMSITPSLQVCGNHSYYNIEDIPGNGGSKMISHIQFMPLYTTGLCTLMGCIIMDLITGQEIIQPPLFTTYVTL